ncbi:hypothetical protein MOQ_004731 [Trypanosoma cruzi marinkellei]|uniref:Uncharacterized protein n=1 Tax=Trypanosoma cruzi marinkellei TaxID=85056 RepID=K2NR68_TRYCR|nr:hypothetical protein MOQ_004731 [Trypanosoma cruzi marinkellei]
MTKKTSKNSHAAAAPVSASALEVRFWNCLKKGDVEGLGEILLVRTEDKETGAVKLAVNREVARSLVNSPNAKKMLPLSYAVSQRMEEEGLHLLLRAGANVDAVDGSSERSTALHAACWGEDDIAVALLLRCGASPLVTDAEGRTPLHVLASLNAAALFLYVLEAATNFKEDSQEGLLCLENRSPVVVSAFELLGKKDVFQFTVLHTAVSDTNSGSDRVLVDLLDFLTQMANTRPAEVETLVNMRTDSEGTALHLLLSCPNLNEGVITRATERLLQLGANPAAMDKWGHTPFSALLMTQSGAAAANVLRILLNAMQKRGEKGQLEEVFLHHDVVTGFALIHHAIASQNADAVKVMVEFLKSVDEADGVQSIRQWLGEVLTREGVHVTFMLAERACDEIAQILINLHAIDEAAYRRCKEDCERQREKQEREREQRAKEREGEGEDEGDDHVAERSTGDYSGFGATANVGSRVQQARKARAQAMIQRRKHVQKTVAEGDVEGFALNRNSRSFWLFVAAALLVFLLFLRVYGVLRDGPKKN